jgi:hypothetical protein
MGLSRCDRHARVLRNTQDSGEIRIVNDRPEAGYYFSIGLRMIREYTPYRPKHECEKCVAAQQRPRHGGRTDDFAYSRNGLSIWQVVSRRPICSEQAPGFSNCGLKYRLSFHWWKNAGEWP